MQEDGKRHCLFFRNEIDRDAILCVHCNSFQNWRRILILGSSFAALIVGGISFVPVGITYFSDWMTPKNSHITARYRGLGGGFQKGEQAEIIDPKEALKNFQYTVLNSGIRTGEIGDVMLQYQIENCVNSTIDLFEKYGIWSVEPGKMR